MQVQVDAAREQPGLAGGARQMDSEVVTKQMAESNGRADGSRRSEVGREERQERSGVRVGYSGRRPPLQRAERAPDLRAAILNERIGENTGIMRLTEHAAGHLEGGAARRPRAPIQSEPWTYGVTRAGPASSREGGELSPALVQARVPGRRADDVIAGTDDYLEVRSR